MVTQDIPRFMSINGTINFIKERYNLPMTRGMLYRRAYQGCFKLVVDELERSRPLVEIPTVVAYYERTLG
jgi:hypothetical protein